MPVHVRFMSVKGKFRTIKEETFPTERDAFVAVHDYYTPLGFRNIQIVKDDEFPDEARITGQTPGGRSGRNIAFLGHVE